MGSIRLHRGGEPESHASDRHRNTYLSWIQQRHLERERRILADFAHSRVLHRSAIPRDRVSRGVEPESLEKHEQDDLCSDITDQRKFFRPTTEREDPLTELDLREFEPTVEERVS